MSKKLDDRIDELISLVQTYSTRLINLVQAQNVRLSALEQIVLKLYGDNTGADLTASQPDTGSDQPAESSLRFEDLIDITARHYIRSKHPRFSLSVGRIVMNKPGSVLMRKTLGDGVGWVVLFYDAQHEAIALLPSSESVEHAHEITTPHKDKTLLAIYAGSFCTNNGLPLVYRSGPAEQLDGALIERADGTTEVTDRVLVLRLKTDFSIKPGEYRFKEFTEKGLRGKSKLPICSIQVVPIRHRDGYNYLAHHIRFNNATHALMDKAQYVSLRYKDSSDELIVTPAKGDDDGYLANPAERGRARVIKASQFFQKMGIDDRFLESYEFAPRPIPERNGFSLDLKVGIPNSREKKRKEGKSTGRSLEFPTRHEFIKRVKGAILTFPEIDPSGERPSIRATVKAMTSSYRTYTDNLNHWGLTHSLLCRAALRDRLAGRGQNESKARRVTR